MRATYGARRAIGKRDTLRFTLDAFRIFKLSIVATIDPAAA